MGFNVGLNPSFANGTALVYHGSLGTTLLGLTEGQTYYAIIDPASPRLVRLAASAADAAEAYQTGLNDFNTNSTADPADVASLGETWFNSGVSAALAQARLRGRTLWAFRTMRSYLPSTPA